MRRLLTKALGWILAILGGYFAVAGTVLASLGGSFYYVIAGVLMVVSGALVGRGDPRGRWLFVAIWLGTLVWSLWEVGLDGLQLVPRLVAPTVLLVLVLLTGIRARSIRSRAHAVPAVAAMVALFLGGAWLLRGESVEAQDATPAIAAATPTPGAENDGEWREYGGTLGGRRYS
ncbi:MAG: membrane-bound PQQ-dependent dehydrogenase, glucose/quinate/shikimate family, partial [Sphingomonas sp.]